MSLHKADPCSKGCSLIMKMQQKQKNIWVVYSVKTESLCRTRCNIKPLCAEKNPAAKILLVV